MNHRTAIHFCRWCCWFRVRGWGLYIAPSHANPSHRGLIQFRSPVIGTLTPRTL